MTLFKTSILLLALGLFSCNSASKATQDKTTETVSMENEKTMEDGGFLKGVIVASETEGDCPYTIRVIGNDNYSETYLLDPINITEEYMKDEEKVWFKFAGLRMMNRCEKASPINIIEMQKREE